MAGKQVSADMVIKLRSSELISNVTDLHELAKEALKADGDVVVDTSDVERVHTPALQVLLALDKGLQDGGRSMKFESDSEAMAEACALLGLGEAYAQWVAQ